ncbi:hypothetical protein CWI69_06395 [Pseudidiomarina halophila]|uniref:Uncharacterized protein n=1 Tax=Pseudidiomarina halophila TaxID=1449799 RepID=A0A432XVI4_9GAMM|nr:hypothetical protein CWI69_06395 [Pseudidiomarina halophila]
MSLQSRYLNYFIRITGGDFVWGGFRYETIQFLVIGYTMLAVGPAVLGAFVAKYWLPFMWSPAFIFLGGFGFLGLFSKKCRRRFLKQNAKADDSKYTFYITALTGIGGVIVIWI